MIKTYLGDNVYAEFNGQSVTLTTEKGLDGDPTNTIVLEPAALATLILWSTRIRNIPEN